MTTDKPEGARPTVRPSQEDRRAMREELERAGLPSDAEPHPNRKEEGEAQDPDLSLASVQPGVPIVKEPIDKARQRREDADVQ